MDRREYTVPELLKLAHEYKCLRIKVGPIEIDLSPAAFGPADAAELAGGEKIPTPEEFQFMAGLEIETVPADESKRPPGAARPAPTMPAHARGIS